ncbi:YqzK family protein [Aquibacillus sp. 3ASR75-11]|uniref:YqzK family protein n=1 Tax=Terrihalobacillus insolitus TaxID=2950438 RepID=A0A9X4AMH9_9BACI|nr:YqzK family protein [Terrihalobacillus insolitus]MDC3413112.1 YqzK family protein [Terrihalobacillus insolitus]MDC3424854.1 YqzK family protein [Terrihalobacillus insolitus]
MKRVLPFLKDAIKICIIFIGCTLLFYYGLRIMNTEYENYHRYDPPSGRAVKVFEHDQQSIIDRLSIFFRLGE